MRVQEVGESTPKASAIPPSSAFTRRPSAAISELAPLAEVEGEGDGGLSEDPDAPEKGMLRPNGDVMKLDPFSSQVAHSHHVVGHPYLHLSMWDSESGCPCEEVWPVLPKHRVGLVPAPHLP